MKKIHLIAVIASIAAIALFLAYMVTPETPGTDEPMDEPSDVSAPSVPDQNTTDANTTDMHEQLETITPYETCLRDREAVTAECRAFRNGDPAVCDILDDEGWKLWCKAKITRNQAYCEQINDSWWDKHNCLIDTADTVEDCNRIDYTNEPYEINECMAYVTNNQSYCENLPEKDRLDCKANMNEDEEYCWENPVFARKWTCLWIHSADDTICDQYLEAYCNLTFPENGTGGTTEHVRFDEDFYQHMINGFDQ
ncbi:MAG: hypothetical protein ACOCWQ_03535 [Nanoarchaeota archaeon]